MMTTAFSPITVTSHVESDVVSELTRFIEDQVRRQCVRLVLAQKIGETHHTVNEWLIEETLGDLRTLALAVYSTGQREAQTLRESVAYGVFAFRGDSPVFVARFFFRVEAGTPWVGSAADTPDERGITAMLMQHTQMSARLSLGHSREIVDQYQTLLVQEHTHSTRLLEQLYARIRVLEAREAEALELREKLQSHAIEREFQVDALKRKDEMRKFAIEKLGPVVPIIMAKLIGAGPPLDPGPAASAAGVVAAAATAAGANVGDELVDRLVQSLTPDQLGEVARLLTPEQLAIFGQLYELAEARIRRSAGSPASAPVPATYDPPPPPPPGAPVAAPHEAARIHSSLPPVDAPQNGAAPANDTRPQPSPEDNKP